MDSQLNSETAAMDSQSNSPETAATRVGSTPEIIGEILSHVYEFHAARNLLQANNDDERTILSSSEVNWKWNREAVRLIWREVGTSFQYPPVGYLVILSDSDVSAIARYVRSIEFDNAAPVPTDPESVGFVTDGGPYIQQGLEQDLLIARFADVDFPESDDSDSDVKTESSSSSSSDSDEGYGLDFHQRLSTVDFPALEDLVFMAPYNEFIAIEDQPLRQYFQPTLKSLVLCKNYEDGYHFAFPEKLLPDVVERCSRLERLELAWEKRLTDKSFVTLAQLIPQMRSLTDLSLEINETSLSSQVLQVIAHHPTLKRVSLKVFEYDEIADFVEAEERDQDKGSKNSPMFPSLEELEVNSDFGLPLLISSSYLCNLKSLTIKTWENTDAVLKSFVDLKFPNLVELTVAGASKIFDGNSLIILASSAPNLKKLCLPSPLQSNMNVPDTFGNGQHTTVTDAAIDRVAELLPDFEFCEMSLQCLQLGDLTDASILSFGRRCPNLHTLDIGLPVPVSHNMDVIVDNPNPVRWENLRFLTITDPGGPFTAIPITPITPEFLAQATMRARKARRLMQLMPKLRTFDCWSEPRFTLLVQALLNDLRDG